MEPNFAKYRINLKLGNEWQNGHISKIRIFA